MAIQIGDKQYHPNTGVRFNGNGMILLVSLNIPPQLAKFFARENVKKGKQRTIYLLQKQIFSKDVNGNNVRAAHEQLMRNLMINIREAKRKELAYEIGRLKNA